MYCIFLYLGNLCHCELRECAPKIYFFCGSNNCITVCRLYQNNFPNKFKLHIVHWYFEINFLCTTRLHLFDKNTVKTVILWKIITILNIYIYSNCNIFYNYNYFCDGKAVYYLWGNSDAEYFFRVTKSYMHLHNKKHHHLFERQIK